MKAVRLHQFGGPEVLKYEDAPQPTIQADQVLVQVHAVGINPVDWKTRRGSGVAQALDLPAIIGWDVSGTVAEIGPDVTQFKPGDEVYGMVNFPGYGGAYAEYVAAPATHLARKPQRFDHLNAAAVPLAALTAYQALFDTAQLAAGQTVLIHAAAGGVGHFAVQLAKLRGATVIGTASARNAGFLRELGIDQVIDYTTTHFEAVVRDVDVVLDAVGGAPLARSYEVVRPGGVLVSIAGQLDAERAAARNVRVERILVEPNRAQLNELQQWIDHGQLVTHLDAVFPLAETAAAHAQLEQGHTRGKIVLQVR